MDEPAKTSERIAQLDSRVTGLELGIQNVASAVRDLSTDFKNDSIRRAEAQLLAQSDARESSKTPWGVILTGVGVIAAVMSTIGGLAYMPIREGIVEVKTSIRDLDKTQVPRVEHEKVWEFQRRIGENSLRRIERLEDDFYRRSPKP